MKMPSPGNTNFERLSIFGKAAAALGRGLAMDEALEGGTVEQIKALLVGKLTAEEIAQVLALLTNGSDLATDDPSANAGFRKSEIGMGLPMPGTNQKAIGLDARTRMRAVDALIDQRSRQAKGFTDRHPYMARLRVV